MKFFTDFSFEQMNWDEKNVHDAHELHEQGHHFHNKTHEEFYHFTAGFSPIKRAVILAQLPYIVRGSIEIEDHDHLGRVESSEGWGDLNLSGIWQWIQEEDLLLGWMAGVKLPTGQTREVNSANVLFEPELQPGTGSTDGTLGLTAQTVVVQGTRLRGNARYTWKGKGDQDFKFGNMMDVHALVERDFEIGLGDPLKLGVDLEWQVEARQTESGTRILDSGGNTVLIGPTLAMNREGWAIFGNILLPVYQNLGGVHQELDFVWNAGAKITW